MARLARYQGTQTLPSVRQPQVVVDDAVGRATAELGQQVQQSAAAVGKLAELYQRRKDEVDNFESKRAFLKFEGDMAQRETKALQNLQPGAVDYAKERLKDWDERQREFIASLPPSMRAQGQILAQDARNRYAEGVSKTEFKERSRYYQEGVVEATNELAKRIGADPSKADEWRAVGHEFIDSSPGTPIEKEAARKAWDRLASLAEFEKLPALRARGHAAAEQARKPSA